MNLFSKASSLKDAALEKALILWLKSKVERYGDIRELKLDTEAKVLRAEINLRGETIPFSIFEAHYRLEPRGTETTLVIYGVKVSREWAQNILDDHFPEIRLNLPDFAKRLL